MNGASPTAWSTPRRRWGSWAEMGRIAGIARHSERRGPVETVASVRISRDWGAGGDRTGGKRRRQVSLSEAEAGAGAMRGVGGDLPWWEGRSTRRGEGLALPQREGVQLRIGDDVVL